MPLGVLGAARNPMRAILLLSAFSVAAILVMAGSIYSSSTRGAFDATYERQHGADIAIWIGGTSCPAAQAQTTLLPSTYTTEIRCAVPGGTRLARENNSIRVSVQILDNLPRLWQLIPRSGETRRETLDASDEPVAIIEDRLAKEAGIRNGEFVRINLGSRALQVRVTGTVSDPSKGPYPLFRPGNIYVSSKTASALGQMPRPDRLFLKTSLPLDTEARQRIIDDVKAAGFVVYESLTTTEFRQMQNGLSAVIEKFVTGVAILATIGAALLVAMLQQAAVVEESREIAILKAMGHTPINIASQILTRSLVIAAAGIVTGSIVGLASYRVIATWAAGLVDAIPETRFEISWLTGTALLVTTMATLFTLYPALTAARLATATTMRNVPSRTGYAPNFGLLLARPVLSVGAGFLTRRPTRAVLAILAVAATLAVILGATGARFFASNLSAEFSGEHFELWVSGTGVSHEGIYDLIRTVPGVIAASPRYSVPQVRDESGQTYWFEAFEIHQDLHRPPLFEGHAIERSDQVVLGPRALERMGAKVGDTVRLEIGGIPVSLQVAGVIRGLRGLGDVGEISVETLTGLGIRPQLNTLMVRTESGSDPDQVARSIFTQSNGTIEARNANIDTAAITEPLTLAMGSSSIVLMVTGVLALVLIMLLTLREFAKELTIMKTMGASVPTLMTGFALYGGLLGLLAAISAIPLSRFLTNVVFGSIMRSLGISASDILGHAPHGGVISMTVVTAAVIGALMSLRTALAKPGPALHQD